MLESLNDVRVFVQIVESNGLSSAARALGLPPNTVSRTLSRLEAAVGTRLMSRTTRRVGLTEEGRTFYERALALLEAATAAETVSRRAGEGVSGTVRVAVRTTTAQFGLIPDVTRLLSEHPDLRVQLTVTDADVDLVGAGLDLALRVGALPDSTLTTRLIGTVTFVPAATRDYLDARGRPAHPRDLAHHECLRALGPRPQTHWSLEGPRGRKEDAPVTGRLECSDVRAQAEALYAGFGIGLRPAGEVRAAVKAGTLERVLPGWSLEPIPVRVVQAGRRTGSTRARALEAVIKLLEGAVARMS